MIVCLKDGPSTGGLFSVASGVVAHRRSPLAWEDWKPSPAPNPGDLAPNATAKVYRGLMQSLFCGHCPKLKLVAVTVAAMAVVAANRHVY